MRAAPRKGRIRDCRSEQARESDTDVSKERSRQTKSVFVVRGTFDCAMPAGVRCFVQDASLYVLAGKEVAKVADRA
jgi:hypothetical protein